MKFASLKSEIKITFIIFVVGISWIIFSGKLLYVLFGDIPNQEFHYAEMYKGIFFITVMSISLFLLLQKHNKKLNESLNSYLSLFRHNPTSMWIYDTETLQFLAVNKSAVSKYGYSREEFLSMKVDKIVIATEVESNTESGIINHNIFSDSGICKLIKKDGSEMYVRQYSHSLTFKNRTCQFTLTEDLTNVISKEIKLRNIAHKNSHQLRKPVANIIGLISLFDTKSFTEENKEIVSLLEKSTLELDQVIKSIAEESVDS